ncbi:MAG: glutamate-5-semialdehyde dehydrogenase, partial [Bdellovibrionales bacterium]|nr:glutamate-5-semialdehyde dehydrogenase [Bdellovibrionales bacterium]
MSEVRNSVLSMARAAKVASYKLAVLSTLQKNTILHAMAESVDASRNLIRLANEQDLSAAKLAGLSDSLIDRLTLSDARISQMVQGIANIIELEDPVGRVLLTRRLANGLDLRKVSVPIGVVAIIFESRPNVTADTAALCLKSSNSVILKGGREALNSNLAIASALKSGGKKAGMPEGAIEVVPITDRDAVRELVQLDELIDVVIPRGGEGLIRAVTEMSRVPVIKHYKGVCHIFVDQSADLKHAVDICENAKCQRPGVCNAMETLLVHEAIAKEFLPLVVARLSERGVELRGDEISRSVVSDIKPASDEDWSTEYLDLILSIKIVRDVHEAIDHINTFGSHHSDSILSNEKKSQDAFTAGIDSAAVYVNASTRFT